MTGVSLSLVVDNQKTKCMVFDDLTSKTVVVEPSSAITPRLPPVSHQPDPAEAKGKCNKCEIIAKLKCWGRVTTLGDGQPSQNH